MLSESNDLHSTGELSPKELKQVADQLCKSKSEELCVLGYRDIDPQTVWKIVSANYPDQRLPPLHQLVNDILSLKANQVMNRMMMNAYKQAEEENPFP